MRLLHVLKNDIRYQARYGFYSIYFILTCFYILILKQINDPMLKATAATLIILSDPAVLGYFFIGGIWLLEKEEGLHDYHAISPLKIFEYVLSKTLSLGIVSTCSATIIAGVTLPDVNLWALAGITFLSSGFFTLIGLLFATFAKTVNGYLMISVPPAIILLLPSILTFFGIKVPLANLTPGTMVLELISEMLHNKITFSTNELLYTTLGLFFWTALLFIVVLRCVARKIQSSGRKKYALNL